MFLLDVVENVLETNKPSVMGKSGHAYLCQVVYLVVFSSNNTPTCEFQRVPILLIWRPRLLCFDQQQEKLDPVRVLAKPIANSPCQVVWKLHVF